MQRIKQESGPVFQPSEVALEHAQKANEAFDAAKSAKDTIGHLALNLDSIVDERAASARTGIAALEEFQKEREEHFEFRLDRAGDSLDNDEKSYNIGKGMLEKLADIKDSTSKQDAERMIEALFLSKNEELRRLTIRAFRGELSEDDEGKLSDSDHAILTLMRISGYSPIVAAEMAVTKAKAQQDYEDGKYGR